MTDERLNRQMLIPGWKQDALSNAKLAVIGGDNLLASMYVMAASALGINNITLVAPNADVRQLDLARAVNPLLNMTCLDGYYSSPVCGKFIKNSTFLVDLSSNALSAKLLLQYASENNLPLIIGREHKTPSEEGFRLFSYMKGREWTSLEEAIAKEAFPTGKSDYDALALSLTGLALEETKSALMGMPVSDRVISYTRQPLKQFSKNPSIMEVGCGALGNFASMGLGYCGLKDLTHIDKDIADITNLNRQPLLHGRIGEPKAITLAQRMIDLFETYSEPIVSYLTRETDISGFNLLIDCVDNFDARILMSERAKEEQIAFISGGTDVSKGQAILYVPGFSANTPAEELGLYEIVRRRKEEAAKTGAPAEDEAETTGQRRASCVYKPNPSVIMSNMIIAGFQIDLVRQYLSNLAAGEDPKNIYHRIFYDTSIPNRIRYN